MIFLIKEIINEEEKCWYNYALSNIVEKPNLNQKNLTVENFKTSKPRLKSN